MSAARFVFAVFELDPARRRLIACGEPLAISDRQLDVLLRLVERAGQIVSKDDLIHAGWKDVAVGDNSLEQAISSLRRLLAAHADGVAFIETVARRGYRFGAAVSRLAARESDASLDALLGPHRAFIEGRAALETLEADQVARARRVFEDALRSAPEHASAHTERIPTHPLARVGFAAAASRNQEPEGDQGEQEGQPSSAIGTGSRFGRALPFEAVLGQAARLAVTGSHVEAARIVDDLLAAAPPGNAAWILPIEPLLHVAARPDCWARPLARLRNRAA